MSLGTAPDVKASASAAAGRYGATAPQLSSGSVSEGGGTSRLALHVAKRDEGLSGARRGVGRVIAGERLHASLQLAVIGLELPIHVRELRETTRRATGRDEGGNGQEPPGSGHDPKDGHARGQLTANRPAACGLRLALWSLGWGLGTAETRSRARTIHAAGR